MPSRPFSWHSFQSLPSDAEAAAYSTACLYSLATLKIAPGDATRFALTEQKQLGVWRWAVCDILDGTLDEGWEPTEARARTAAEEALPRAVA